jgi:lipid-binding SYLF domain-containing protein
VKKEKSRSMFISFIMLGVVALAGGVFATSVMAASPQEELVAKARDTVASFHFDPGLDWFHKNVKKAKAVFILPEVYEGAFIIGASGGEAVYLVQDKNSGLWSNPAFYEARSVSLGLKAGGQKSEVIAMVMTDKAIKAFMEGGFKLGADLKAVIGPGSATAATPSGDLITFGRSKGLLLGSSLVGATINIDKEANEAYYKQPVTPKDIVLKRSVENPQALPLRVGITESAKKPETGIMTQEKEKSESEKREAIGDEH